MKVRNGVEIRRRNKYQSYLEILNTNFAITIILKLARSSYKPSSLIGLATVLILLSNLAIYPLNPTFSSFQQTDSVQQQKEQITLRAILTDLGDPNRWNSLIQPALQELRNRHSDLDIQIALDANNPYNITRNKLIDVLSNQSSNSVDLISLDQIWLGEFAERGFLTNLTDKVQQWGRLSDWYEMAFFTTIPFMVYGHGLM